MKVVMAVDPGITGGIAVREADGKTVTYTMPVTLKDKWDFFHEYKQRCDRENWGVFLLGEDAGYHRFGNNAVASCKFARHCGQLELAYTAAELPFELVLPQKWMHKLFGTRLPKERNERKNYIKEFVQRLHPTLKVTLDVSDALALLHYALQREGGEDNG